MKIGFVVPDLSDYYTVMASTRLRCYDVINMFRYNIGYKVEIFNKKNFYDLVIFQKSFKQEHYDLAMNVKEKGSKVCLDINVNYIYSNVSNEFVTKDHHEDIKKMVSISDFILTSSSKLFEIYSQYHKSVFCIEEVVTNNFFKVKKKHESADKIFLLYCGYSIKAKDILLIKDVLVELNREFNIEMLYITEQDPEIDVIPYKFIKYDQKNLPKLLLKADIKIAPRDLGDNYNIGHSLSKIAYPMSVGVPAVTSPLQSYLNRTDLICYTENDWYFKLSRLVKDHKLRNFYGNKSRNVIINNCSFKKIQKDYLNFFELIKKGVL